MLNSFWEWLAYLPFTIPSVAIGWIVWTCLDAYWGGKLMGAVRQFKRRIRGHKKPGRKSYKIKVENLNKEITSLKRDLASKEALAKEVKKVVAQHEGKKPCTLKKQ